MSADTILAYVSALLSVVLATGGAIRAGRSLSRWAFVAGMTVLTLERIASGLVNISTHPDQLLYWQTWRLTAAALLPGVWLLFSLTYARGNAALFIRKWRVALAGALLLPLLLVTAFRSSLFHSVASMEQSSALFFKLGPAGNALQLLLLITCLLVLVNLERTYRASVGTVRWRIKFMLMGAAVLFLVRLFTASQALLFGGIISSLDDLHSGALLLGGLLMLRSLFRAGHFELDVHPSHSVLRNSVTVLLAGVYLVIVGVFAKVAALLGGDSAFPIKALLILVSLVGLAVLLQSDRVQLWLRHFISRHFQRPLHDYQAIWRQFTEGTASQVDQADYSRAVVRLLAEIFQALSVTLWVAEERQESFTLAASTSVSGKQSDRTGPTESESRAVFQHLRYVQEPVDIENLPDAWAAALRRCHPEEFHEGGRRICVPLLAGGDLQALVILGDRVGGTPFNAQDLDLLRAIGSHIAAGLLNVRLSRRVLQAREHEAFQTMATFFVHDLKNAATTLNLMLRNLPDHFDDPAFREDALRGASKSVAHINHLISRLSQLRHELTIQAQPADFNALVTATVKAQGDTNGIQVGFQLQPLPPVALDPVQLGKVITNLVINAREAMGATGSLGLATELNEPWVILSVTDTGCGMTPEFIAKSLFRPFQTTKKNGLGIGMFQSKMIVEAHGGRFSVESRPGHGTTFRVFLPCRPTPHR